ncbi:CRISPR-associated endonuclease Cas2 [Collinsella sp. AGMB00827]|uniref:CRISPR-associated endoribonuclease Cas2 n=1 Tax=Collinsella ureilytica TaxID=2869515 RepID=A0ABS7MLK5_9ACTN|nr:CRISPR-associated endonuclease Cas2 [Collinsella urealyticum]MBY4798244.1 CRISPR-associated endonuclease Cas2 [Collinsella urealyticum]
MSEERRIRFMRLLVLFDLPVGTAAQKKRYAAFRKFLIKEGYLMLQNSVYSKLLLNEAAVASALTRLQANRPSEGLVQALRVTERQFATMVCIAGKEVAHDEVDTMENFLVL